MEDYIKIYEECLNRSYHNEKIEPIINNLYDIVNYYDRDIKDSNTATNKEESIKYYNNVKRNIMSDLLMISNVIIDMNQDYFISTYTYFRTIYYWRII